jgi:thiol:disulfide interchange protein DsbC
MMFKTRMLWYMACALVIAVLLSAFPDGIAAAAEKKNDTKNKPAENKSTGGNVLTAEDVAAVMKPFAPDVKVIYVEPAPIAGFWETAFETQGKKGVAYIEGNKKHIVFGRIIDAATGDDLTEKKISDLNKLDVSKIPLDGAVVMGKPDAKNKVIVFDDPECPFCAKLHVTIKGILEKRPDTAFYLILYPLTQIHPNSLEKSRAILCAGSNEKALKLLDDAFNGKDIPKADCNSAQVYANMGLAGALGVKGTPFIIFGDGRTAGGALEEDAFLKMIDGK